MADSDRRSVLNIGAPRAPLAKLPALKERDTTAQCKGHLEAYGWTLLRLQAGTLRGLKDNCFIRLNKKSTPDWWVMKPLRDSGGLLHGFYMEMKKPKGKARDDQAKRIAELQQRGYKAVVIDGLEALQQFLRSEGL